LKKEDKARRVVGVKANGSEVLETTTGNYNLTRRHVKGAGGRTGNGLLKKRFALHPLQELKQSIKAKEVSRRFGEEEVRT